MMSLLQMSFSGAVLILVIAAIRAVTINRLPKKIFLILWGIALFRLLIPYTVPSAFSVYNFLNPQMPVYETDTNFTNQAGTVNTTAQTPANVISSPIEPIAAPQANELVDLPANKITIVSEWALIQMTGTLLSAIFFIISYLHWRFEFQTSLPVQSDFVEQWRKTHSLKRPIQIRQSDKISAPLTYGIIKPVILMPKKTDWENTGQLECVLLHEFVHIRRYDSVAKMICTIALCLHWFNPLVWVMYILFQRDIELACDESVVRRFGEASKAMYAHMLIDMEARKSGLMPLCNNFSKNAIEERIIAIMTIRKTTVIAVLSAIILIVGITTVFATSAAAQKAENNKYDNTNFSEEETDKLLALQFDGYEDMSISEFQKKAWELTDTKEYLDFLDRVSQDTAFYEKRDSDELANFLFYTFNSLTGDQWRTREFGGYCKIGNDDLSDSASLEYFITLDIQNVDALTVKEYNNTRIEMGNALQEWLQDKTMEMLQEEAAMQKMLYAETEVLKTQWSSEKLKVDIDYVYTPLSYHVKEKAAITVEERDHCVNGVMTGIQEFWNKTDELNVETEEKNKTGVIKLNLFPNQKESSGNTNLKNEMNAKALRVREEASENAAVVYLLPEGQEVMIIGEEKGFYHISDVENGFDGWVIKEYVDEIDIIKE